MNQLGIIANKSQLTPAALGDVSFETKGLIFQNLANNVEAYNRPLSDEIAGNRGYNRGKRARGEALTGLGAAALELYEGKTVTDLMIEFKNTLPARFEELKQRNLLFSPKYSHIRNTVLGTTTQTLPAPQPTAMQTIGAQFKAPLYLVGGVLVIGGIAYAVKKWME